MRESEYTRAVTKLLPRDVYALKLSTSYTAGVPDSWYSGSRGDLWVEWKYFKDVPLVVDLCSGKHPVLTRLQQDWLKGRHREGRNVAVIVGTPTGAVIYEGLRWQYTFTREQFDSFMQTRADIAAWITQQCVRRHASAEIVTELGTSKVATQPRRS